MTDPQSLAITADTLSGPIGVLVLAGVAMELRGLRGQLPALVDRVEQAAAAVVQAWTVGGK